jgi:imidazole glycerol phosphate synthase subunit HisF
MSLNPLPAKFGGAGTLAHFYEGVVEGDAQILLAASVFHYCILGIRKGKEYQSDTRKNKKILEI